jgi:hypothetical protein
MIEVRLQEKQEDVQLRNTHSITGYDGEKDPLTARSPLPCHYFDYVVGTSTGGYAACPQCCPDLTSDSTLG